MRWLKYLLYLLDLWEPKTEYEKLLVLLYEKPNPYKHDHLVYVVTQDVFHSIEIMEKLLNKDPKKEYLFTSEINLGSVRRTYLNKWYSYKNRYLDKDVFLDWLELSYKIYKLKDKCLKAKQDTKEYKNGVKLKIITDEIDSIVKTMI